MTINDFLKKIESDIKISNKDYNSDDFYYMLKYLGVKKNKGLVSDIEVFYNDFLKIVEEYLREGLTLNDIIKKLYLDFKWQFGCINGFDEGGRK